MNNQNIIFSGKFHDFFIKSRSGNASHRIRRKRDHHILCLSRYVFRNPLYIWKKIMFLCQRIIVRLCSCHQTSCCKNRITGIRKQYNIPFVTERHSQMPHTLLTSIYRHHHIRSDLHLKTFLVIITHCLQKFGKIPQTVLPVLIIQGSLCKCFFYVIRSGKIRSSHTHIINLHSLLFQLHSPIVQSCKNLIAKSVQPF